ncbi:MAG TPA: MFS transporter [Blastocatellia bacterium]|nr:MFS transporter [Blastocatellia bacterium]
MEVKAHDGARAQKWLCFLTVVLGTVVDYTDSTMINIALPTMARSFQVDLSDIELIVTSYLLMITVLVIIFGRVADIYGRKRLYLTGFVIFTVASALCGAAPAIWLLVVFRCLQGIGGALLIANSMAILTESFPPTERGKALGILGSIIAGAIIVGPILGGFLSDHLGWRAVFYVNVPIGIAGFLLGMKVLASQVTQEHRERFDSGGALTFIASLSCFLILINTLSDPAWSVTAVGVLLVATLAFGALFFSIESRIEYPLLDLDLFRRRAFGTASGSAYLVLWSLSLVAFLLPFYLDRVLLLSPTTSGYILAPIAMFLVIFSPLGGHLADRFGPRPICMIGALTICFGLICLSTIGMETSALGVVLRLVPIGVGGGLFMPANNSAIMGAVPSNRFGVASGLIGAIRNFAAMSGVAVTSLVFTVIQSNALERAWAMDNAAEFAERQAFVSSVRVMFLIGAAICSAAVITSFVRRDEKVEGGEESLAAAEGVSQNYNGI